LLIGAKKSDRIAIYEESLVKRMQIDDPKIFKSSNQISVDFSIIFVSFIFEDVDERFNIPLR